MSDANMRGSWGSRLVLSVSVVALSWYGMMAVHELGHVLAAWATGVEVEAVILHPLALSNTLVEPGGRTLTVVWAGALVGVLLPLAMWGAVRWTRWSGAFLLRFFAGFCLIANGAYLGVGWLERAGDAAELVDLGTPVWVLVLFGLVTVPAGLALWHGLGPAFGWGRAARPVSAKLAYGVAAPLAVTLLLGFLFGKPAQ